MKAIAGQTGTEEEFGEHITSTQHMLPPRGASEIEMKVCQVRGGQLVGIVGDHTASSFLAISDKLSPAEACGGCHGVKLGRCR